MSRSEVCRMLLNEITSLSSSFGQTFILVDGIDECSNPIHLCKALASLANPRIKVLAVSRGEREIAEAFRGLSHLELTEKLVAADIQTYINKSLEDGDGLKKIKTQLKNEIRLKLLANNTGT